MGMVRKQKAEGGGIMETPSTRRLAEIGRLVSGRAGDGKRVNLVESDNSGYRNHHGSTVRATRNGAALAKAEATKSTRSIIRSGWALVQAVW